MIQFYSRLIPNFTELCRPLNELRSQSVKFEITPSVIESFERIKMALSSRPCVKPYDLNSPVILRVDASEYSIGGVLLQDGHPVMYLSRKLSSAETNYSNIEREALAIVWGVERSKKMLLGRKFTIQTDHEPLKYIFRPNKSLSKNYICQIDTVGYTVIGL